MGSLLNFTPMNLLVNATANLYLSERNIQNHEFLPDFVVESLQDCGLPFNNGHIVDLSQSKASGNRN